jgi:hypothetical protein
VCDETVPSLCRLAEDVDEVSPQLVAADPRRDSEPTGHIALEPLEQRGAGAERTGDVGRVVAREDAFEPGNRLRIGPALEEAPLVPRVGLRPRQPCVPPEQDEQEVRLVAVAAAWP